MKAIRSVLVLTVLLAIGLTVGAGAQSVDAYFGLNALTAGQAVSSIPKLGGGLYPSFGADLIFFHGLGVGGQVAWRGGQSDYFGNGVRPIFYDFDAMYEPSISREVVPQISVGIGAQSLRFYQGLFTCGTFTGCTDYTSSNHFSGHIGLGAKIYVTGHIFLRPSADFYFIRNGVEYDVSRAQRFGLSIGYTLGGGS